MSNILPLRDAKRLDTIVNKMTALATDIRSRELGLATRLDCAIRALAPVYISRAIPALEQAARDAYERAGEKFAKQEAEPDSPAN